MVTVSATENTETQQKQAFREEKTICPGFKAPYSYCADCDNELWDECDACFCEHCDAPLCQEHAIVTNPGAPGGTTFACESCRAKREKIDERKAA